MRGRANVALICAALAGCSFKGPGNPAGDGDGDNDAGPDATLPVSDEVVFTSITADITELRPGLYGFEVTAVLENQLDVEITDVRVSLTMNDGTDSRSGDFFWRDRDAREGASAQQPDTVAAGASETFVFVVDALVSAAPPGPIAIDGIASFDNAGETQAASGAAEPLSLPFEALNPPIVVTEPVDESDGDNDLCLREAILAANSQAGFDRIVFDSTAFPPGSLVDVEFTLGPLPTVSDDLVIDGTGTGPIVKFDADWSGNNNYGVRLSAGTLVIGGLTFRDMGYGYQDEDIAATGNCGPNNTQYEGGAIRVDGGTLIVDGNTFEDPDVPERNCYGASIRLEGGADHRIVRNHWTSQSMDSIFVNSAAFEISDNVMDSNPAMSDKSDECVYIGDQGNQDLWLIGNVCIDQEFSAVISEGNNQGILHVVNNTFVRTGISGLAAVRRNGDMREVVMRNNVYIGNNAGVAPGNDGSDFDIGYEASDIPLCGACGSATVTQVIENADLMVVDSSGSQVDDFLPRGGSPLTDSAEPLVDRNGKSARWYGGAGPERGALER